MPRMADNNDTCDPVITIPILSKENYRNWARYCNLTLTIEEVWEYVDKDIPPPADPAERKKYNLNKIRAVHMIEQSISEDIMLTIESNGYNIMSNDPRQLWQHVKNVVGGQNISEFNRLHQEFITLKRSDFHTLKNLVNRPTYIKIRFDDFGVHYYDRILISTSLNAMRGHNEIDMAIIESDFEKGELTWMSFLATMRTIAERE